MKIINMTSVLWTLKSTEKVNKLPTKGQIVTILGFSPFWSVLQTLIDKHKQECGWAPVRLYLNKGCGLHLTQGQLFIDLFSNRQEQPLNRWFEVIT